MQIEVVKPGDTLWTISRRYGVAVDRIAALNALTDPSRLVVGQALVIPTTDAAQAGSQAKPNILVNAYLQPAQAEKDQAVIRQTAPALTYFSIFEYRVTRTGELLSPQDEAALEEIRSTTAKPKMVIANFEEGNFSPEITRAIFNDAAVRNRLIDVIISTMRAKGFTALNIDFENIYPEDRDRYTAFLRAITARIHQEGWLVSTALAPKTSGTQKGSWYEGHDYGAHGQIVDFVIIMTYEWGWSGGPPMAVAPIPQVRAVLDYAVTVIPRNKIVMGAPLYGYDWTLPYVEGGPFARAFSPQAAVEQALRVNAAISFDPVAEAPYYRYYDDQGREHVVWFEDARSMQAKFNLIKEYGLDGISYWVLDHDFPQNWVLLMDQFTIRKV